MKDKNLSSQDSYESLAPCGIPSLSHTASVSPTEMSLKTKRPAVAVQRRPDTVESAWSAGHGVPEML